MAVWSRTWPGPAGPRRTPAGPRGTPCWSQAGDQVPYGPSSALVVVVELCISGPGLTRVLGAGSDLEEHLRTFDLTCETGWISWSCKSVDLQGGSFFYTFVVDLDPGVSLSEPEASLVLVLLSLMSWPSVQSYLSLSLCLHPPHLSCGGRHLLLLAPAGMQLSQHYLGVCVCIGRQLAGHMTQTF